MSTDGNLLIDSSGNDYHGTINGATQIWVEGTKEEKFLCPPRFKKPSSKDIFPYT